MKKDKVKDIELRLYHAEERIKALEKHTGRYGILLPKEYPISDLVNAIISYLAVKIKAEPAKTTLVKRK